jgi:hypothetical protein
MVKEASPAKKKTKKKVKMEDNENVTQTLAKLGALPPSSDDEEGIVDRDIDILSEEPEIDTTRAEERPKRRKLCLVFFAMCVLTPFFVVLAVSGIAFLVQNSKCSVSMLLDQLTNMNASDIELGIRNMYSDCSV